MNKELKQKLIKHNKEMRAAFPNLYDQRWVEREADKGYKRVVKSLQQTFPDYKLSDSALNIFSAVFYSAFEEALNTFFRQCLDDTLTTAELTLQELQKITAEIKTKEV